MYFMYVSWLDRNSYCRHITARCSFYTCGYYSMSWVDPSSLAKLTWTHFAQHAFAHCNVLLCWGSSVHSNSSTCIQLEYLYTWKCSKTLATFIIVKYPVCLKILKDFSKFISCIFEFLFVWIASYLDSVHVPISVKCMKFVSQKILFLLFSLKEEKLCLEKEYQEQPKLAVSIAGTVMI